GRILPDAVGGRVLARLGSQPAAPAHLRHGLAHQRRTAGLPRTHCRSRAPRPSPPGRRTRSILFSRRDWFWATRIPPQGRNNSPRNGGILPQTPPRSWLSIRKHSPHHQVSTV